MNFSWYDAWPLVAMVALIYGATCATCASTAREWWARRAARRRAHTLLAPEPDLTPCIRRAGYWNAINAGPFTIENHPRLGQIRNPHPRSSVSIRG